MGCLSPVCVFSLTQSDFDQYLGVILAAGITKDKGIIQSYGKMNLSSECILRSFT